MSKRDAAIYREQARFVFGGASRFLTGLYKADERLFDLLDDTFQPAIFGDQDRRTLAMMLCLMAAIAEAGDA